MPTELVQIERFCGSRVFPGGFTDAKGKFTVRIGNADPGATLPDASNQGRDFRGRGIGDPNRTGGITGPTESMGVVRNPGTVDMFGCDLRACLEGYRSDAIELGRRSVFDKPDVGTIVLHPYEGVKEAFVSATNLQAPTEEKNCTCALKKNGGRRGQTSRRPGKISRGRSQPIRHTRRRGICWANLGFLSKTSRARSKRTQRLWRRTGCTCVPLIKLNVRAGQWLRTYMLSSNLQGLNPGSLNARFYTALSAFQLERHDDAEQAIRALLTDPAAAREFPLADHLKGMIHAKRGEFETAAKAYRAFLETDFLSPTAEDVKRQLNEWEVLGVVAGAAN